MNIEEAIQKIESKLRPLFNQLVNVNRKIKGVLTSMRPSNKTLKGDEVVGWLGEIYAAEILSGTLLANDEEADVKTPTMRVSVKARKATSSNWPRTSDIHKIKGANCTHLIFLKFDKEYRLENVWLYPWEVVEERAKPHKSRGNNMGYYFRVKPRKDNNYKKYPVNE